MKPVFNRIISLNCFIAVILSFSTTCFALSSDIVETDSALQDLENAYIYFTESIEAEGKEVLLSYDSFVEDFNCSDSSSIEQFIQSEIEKEHQQGEGIIAEQKTELSRVEEHKEIETVPERVYDYCSREELEDGYQYLIDKYPYLEGNLTSFAYSFLMSNSTTLDSFIANVEQMQNGSIKYASSRKDRWYQNTGTNLPRKANYSDNRLLENVKKGDLIYENGGLYAITTGHISTVEGIFYSPTYKQFYIRVIEALKPRVCRSILDDNRVSELNSVVLRVCSTNNTTITDINRNNAVKYCQTKVDCDYKLEFGHQYEKTSEDWYCSELAWASYKYQDIDIEVMEYDHADFPGVVAPMDLLNSAFTSVVSINTNRASFNDISNSFWAFQSISYVAKNGLMVGVSNHNFAPNIAIDRKGFVTVLYRLAATPTIYGSHPFTDVPSSYYIPVAWAKKKSITNGTSTTTFSPNSPVTREQFVTMLYRFADMNSLSLSTGNVSLSSYTDAGNISSYATTPMKWAISKGLIQGTSSNTLSPKATCSRAQAATIITRFMPLITKKLSYTYPGNV